MIRTKPKRVPSPTPILLNNPYGYITIVMNEYAGHIKQYQRFVDAARLICDDLDMSFKDEKIDRAESDRGSTYHIYVGGKYTLDFSLNTVVKANKIQETHIQVKIKYDKDSVSFDESDDIAEYVNEDGYLERWTTQALHNFNLKHHPVELDALFGKADIRVYGTYNDPDLALKEMKLFMDGMWFAKTDKPAYRFRHVDSLMRTYSYCFFVSDGSAVPFWAFFHNMGGLDNGYHISRHLKKVEDMITINISTDLKCHDVEYARLRKFLSEHVTAFNRVTRNTLSFDLNHVSDNFGTEFSETYSKFLESCDNEEYSRALRDLRALLQTAMEGVCKEKGVPLPDNPDINKLCAGFIKHGLLDGKETTRYGAFSVVANTSAHRVFPTENDLLDQNTKDKVKTAILLGTQLVADMDDMMTYTDDFDENDSDVPEV